MMGSENVRILMALSLCHPNVKRILSNSFVPDCGHHKEPVLMTNVDVAIISKRLVVLATYVCQKCLMAWTDAVIVDCQLNCDCPIIQRLRKYDKYEYEGEDTKEFGSFDCNFKQ